MSGNQSLGPPLDPSLSSQNLGPTVVACAVTTTLLAGAAVAARFYTRGRILRVLGTEDWLILTSFVRGMVGYSSTRRITSCSKEERYTG